jgi:hypothetical protein
MLYTSQLYSLQITLTQLIQPIYFLPPRDGNFKGVGLEIMVLSLTPT